MTRLRLRTMLLVPLLLSLLLGIAALGVFVHRSVERDLIGTIDSELTRARITTNPGPGPNDNRPGRPPERELPISTEDAADADDADDTDEDSPGSEAPVEVTFAPDGTVLEANANSEALAAMDLTAFFDTDGPFTIDGEERLRALVTRHPSGNATIVALRLAATDEALASLRRNLIVASAALLAIQGLLAGLVVRAVNRPISQLSAASRRIADGDLHAPVGLDSGPQEAVTLGEDLDTMVGRLRDTIAERGRAAALAEQARSDMERFMADASHELRTPLTALKGYSELYEGGMLDDDGVQRAMSRVGTESQRLTELVNDLLRLLRPTDARSVEKVDLGAIASAVAQDLRAAHSDHALALRLDGSVDSTVLGDPTRLHQAVLNLGANACQHTPPGTPVEICVDRTDDQVELRIVDHGPGIDPDVADQLFQPFVRGDRSRSRRNHDGAGLGLTITQRIAEQHAGSVDVSPTPGGGATITLRLPAVG